MRSICSEDGCGKFVDARGLCSMHYRRWKLQHNPPCSIEGCTRPSITFGWCATHYMRFHKYGDALFISRAENGEPSKWLVTSVPTHTEDSGCIEWPFGLTTTGYGELWHEGIKYKAPVLALILSGKAKPPPPNNYALHSCDNPVCINTFHLRWGSQSDNIRDIYLRGRGNRPRGSANVLSKLDEQSVKLIRSSTLSKSALGQQFGVSPSTISAVLSGRTWKHV